MKLSETFCRSLDRKSLSGKYILTDMNMNEISTNFVGKSEKGIVKELNISWKRYANKLPETFMIVNSHKNTIVSIWEKSERYNFTSVIWDMIDGKPMRRERLSIEDDTFKFTEI